MQVKHLKRGTVYNVIGTAAVLGGILIEDDSAIIIFKNEEGIFVHSYYCTPPSFDSEFVYFGRAQTDFVLTYGDKMVVYQDIKDRKVYARAEKEFWDGRFVEIKSQPDKSPARQEAETMANDTGNYPDFVFVAYDEDFSAQTHDVAVSLEAGSLVGVPVKYVRHNLNPRPAAPVEGLETVGYVTTSPTGAEVFQRKPLVPGHGQFGYKQDAVVTRSQAEELLAAERAETMRQVKHWSELYKQQHYRAEKAEADNAAKDKQMVETAQYYEKRISELETQLAAEQAEKEKAEDGCLAAVLVIKELKDNEKTLTARVEELTKLLEVTEKTAINELSNSQKLEKQISDMNSKMQKAYLKGFQSSGQGWNNEYPFMDGNKNPEKDDHWIKVRNESLGELENEK